MACVLSWIPIFTGMTSDCHRAAGGIPLRAIASELAACLLGISPQTLHPGLMKVILLINELLLGST